MIGTLVKRGTMAYAGSGKNSRGTQIWIAFQDSSEHPASPLTQRNAAPTLSPTDARSRGAQLRSGHSRGKLRSPRWCRRTCTWWTRGTPGTYSTPPVPITQ